MLNFDTFQLTSEQQALIPVYRTKWKSIALSTEKIDCTSATTAINATYQFINLDQPDILFCATPYAALEYILNEIQDNQCKFKNISLGNPVAGSLIDKLLGNIRIQLKKKILNQLQGNVDDGLTDSIASETVICNL
ncbi:MAG: hypothetical protein QNJ32_10055 [Xenococcaceae cyanobacterium MO_167.B27]|nr:hypothetical protein [Xenococcaceae cyanobacterium MO_167.B27]